MPSNRRKPSKVVERPKTRKELRKDKRLQKKANRVHYHKKKKELKIEYRERLKQKKSGKLSENTKPKYDDDIPDNVLSGGEVGSDADDNDEEIDSDFTLSDEEMEQKFQNKSRFVVSAYILCSLAEKCFLFSV